MSYRVLARAYRSGTFDEVVGQETISTTLKNAITSGRVHHGYLFTGTRGVGKTSMARILAKALNCLSVDAPTAQPCCTCESCTAVAEGQDIDVVEIDAASNTGVDNIRELRSNATLRPARARFKVYIIDEVHMLSAGAFNALLKTLEEPPPHVKFILATTESQKVPATIQSRCQRFDFRAIETNAIAAHLGKIAESENIKTDDGVLRRIARLANGSMRDALSLLDKLLSYEAEHLTREVVDAVIPPPHDELSLAVMGAVGEGDAAKALAAMDQALQTGRTVERFCDHLIDHVRTLMLLRVCGSDTDLVDVAGPARPALVEQSERFDAPTYVYMITLLEELRRNVKFSGAARALADAAVVRLAMSDQFTDIGAIIERLDDDAGTGPVDGSGGAAGSGTINAEMPRSAASKKKEAAELIAEAEKHSDTLLGDAPRGASKSAPVTKAVTPATARADAPVSRALRERASRDPLVERVRQAVDGTLAGVREIHPTEQSSSSNDDPAMVDDGNEQSSTTE